jgi:uncharacterized membrane protein
MAEFEQAHRHRCDGKNPQAARLRGFFIAYSLDRLSQQLPLSKADSRQISVYTA